MGLRKKKRRVADYRCDGRLFVPVKGGGNLLRAEEGAECFAVEDFLSPIGVDRNGTMELDRMSAPVQDQQSAEKTLGRGFRNGEKAEMFSGV